MESNTKHSDNIFTLLDGIFTKYLHGMNSTIELNDYTIKVSNIAITCPVDLVPKERFIVDFIKNEKGKTESRARFSVDSDGKSRTTYNCTIVKIHNGWKHYDIINSYEIYEVFGHLKRKYNLYTLLD